MTYSFKRFLLASTIINGVFAGVRDQFNEHMMWDRMGISFS